MNVEREISALQARNKRVEAEKAWEVSWTRAGFIAVATYLIAGVWLTLIHDSYPWAKALVPSVGYILSTLSLPVLKRKWIEYHTH